MEVDCTTQAHKHGYEKRERPTGCNFMNHNVNITIVIPDRGSLIDYVVNILFFSIRPAKRGV